MCAFRGKKEYMSTLEKPCRAFGKLVMEGFRTQANVLMDNTKLSFIGREQSGVFNLKSGLYLGMNSVYRRILIKEQGHFKMRKRSDYYYMM